MKGIQIVGGATFVEHDGITVRLKNGKCELSPVMLPSLEWDLRTEPPHTWDYLLESDIRALGEDVFAEILRIVNEVKQHLEQ
jgi:hypothetical protein